MEFLHSVLKVRARTLRKYDCCPGTQVKLEKLGAEYGLIMC